MKTREHDEQWGQYTYTYKPDDHTARPDHSGKCLFPHASALVSVGITAEMEIGRALAYAKLGNMEAFITSFEKGVRMAKELGSEKRKQEAMGALHAALERWPNGQRITGLWELLV